VPLFDPAHRASEISKATVMWEYGTQQFEVRCLPRHNLKLLALRTVIAWPLLMSVVVIFFSIIVYLVLKRMQAIEKDVNIMEKMNEALKIAKLAAEAADKAKSNFLATVSHEIRSMLMANLRCRLHNVYFASILHILFCYLTSAEHLHPKSCYSF